jgi:hypothetical protein
MRRRKVIRTTLGDLIVAVTNEVMPIIHDSANTYAVVAWVLNDVLTHHRLRDHKRSLRKYQS